jgi:deaminated glutathione amidase
MTGNPKLLKSLRVACIQMDASHDGEANLLKATALAARAVRQKSKFIAFPENFLWRGSGKNIAEASNATGPILSHFQDFAKKTKTVLLLGSLLEPSHLKKKYYTTSFLISETGKVIAKYRKIHLFRINFKQVCTDESVSTHGGSEAVVGKVFGVPAGLTVCYDLRFPELFRRLVLKGARIMTVPSNFTEHTGKAHWEVLLRARAIENQVFIIAPGQVGTHPSTKIRSFGNSLIIDPWGKVLARGHATREEVVIADLDFAVQSQLRRNFPVLTHIKMI